MQSILHLCELCDFPCICSTFFMRTVCTFFTLIEFFCSPIFVSLYGSAVNVMEFLLLGHTRSPFSSMRKFTALYGSLWYLYSCFFFIHGKFHVFSHSVFFTVQIVVEASIACVGNWIFQDTFHIFCGIFP